MEYLAQRTLYSELVGVLLSLGQRKFEKQREDLCKTFGKEIACVALYTAPQRLIRSLFLIRFVQQELQSRALIQRSFEIAAEKWGDAFGEELEIPAVSTDVDPELKSVLSAVIMTESKAAIPEFGERVIRERWG